MRSTSFFLRFLTWTIQVGIVVVSRVCSSLKLTSIFEQLCWLEARGCRAAAYWHRRVARHSPHQRWWSSKRRQRERGAGERYVAGQRLWRAKKKDCNEYNRLRYTLRNELPSKLVFYSSWLTLHIDHHHGTVTVYNPFLFLMIPDHLRFLMRIGLEATLLNGNAEGTVFEKSLEVSHLIISERAKWAIYFQRKCICPNSNYSHFWRENSTIWKVFAKVKIRIFGIIFSNTVLHCWFPTAE